MWKKLLIGIGLIMATNAVALIGVAYNRSGEPESVVTVSERELRLPYGYSSSSENSGLSLKLVWRVKDRSSKYGCYQWGSPEWLDKEKLAELGFDVSEPERTYKKRRYYREMLPKEVLLVFEYDGDTYRSVLASVMHHVQEEEALWARNPDSNEFKRRFESARDQLKRERHTESRLFVIDAGLDKEFLRKRYPDTSRYIIAPGKIRLSVGTEKHGEVVLSGYIKSVSVRRVNVPLAYRDIVEPLLRKSSSRWPKDGPRYSVKLAYGKRLEPWVMDVTRYVEKEGN